MELPDKKVQRFSALVAKEFGVHEWNEAKVGAGNDYIAIDGRGIDLDWGKLSLEMSRPHFGVYSDGIVVLKNSDIANTAIKIFNPDGSEAEMSGNGVRLFSKFVLDNKLSDFNGNSLTCLLYTSPSPRDS